jgi:hypothetical protein
MAVGFFGKLLHGGSKVSKTINKVDPFVPQTKAEISARDLRRAKQKTKTSQVKLDNTLFRIKQEKDKLEKMKTEKKAKGGRVGYKKGTPKRQTNIQKIKKTFGPKNLGMQSVIYGLDKNPQITKADPKAKFIAAANKKNKKKVI